MKFYNMGNRPLEYPVLINSKVLIPAGATHVKIAFRQSPFTYLNERTGKREHLNVYMWQGRYYHA